jgi:hypothetical protein
LQETILRQEEQMKVLATAAAINLATVADLQDALREHKIEVQQMQFQHAQDLRNYNELESKRAVEFQELQAQHQDDLSTINELQSQLMLQLQQRDQYSQHLVRQGTLHDEKAISDEDIKSRDYTTDEPLLNHQCVRNLLSDISPEDAKHICRWMMQEQQRFAIVHPSGNRKADKKRVRLLYLFWEKPPDIFVSEQEAMVAVASLDEPVRAALGRVRLMLAKTVAGGRMPDLFALLLQPAGGKCQGWHLDSWSDVMNAIVCLQDGSPQTEFRQAQQRHDEGSWEESVPSGKWDGQPHRYVEVGLGDVILFLAKTVHRGAANYKSTTRAAIFTCWPRSAAAKEQLTTQLPTVVFEENYKAGQAKRGLPKQKRVRKSTRAKRSLDVAR